jgi:hypothetical protein
VSFEAKAARYERIRGRPTMDDMVVTVAADFLRGGVPTFARAFDRRGSLVFSKQRLDGESWAAFRARARAEAGRVAGACCLVIGGLPDAVSGPAFGNGGGDGGGRGGGDHDQDHDGGHHNDVDDLPRGVITLPEAALHPSQLEALDLIRQHRRVALVCGRRWGKSTILITLAVDAALSGKRVGMFAPTRTLMSPLLMEIARALRPIPGA